MNFKVNLLFHLYKTTCNPSWYPHSNGPEGEWCGGLGGGGIMEKNKLTLKYISGKIKCFITIFFFQWKTGSSRTHTASLMENSINFFLKPSISCNFCPLTISISGNFYPLTNFVGIRQFLNFILIFQSPQITLSGVLL